METSKVFNRFLLLKILFPSLILQSFVPTAIHSTLFLEYWWHSCRQGCRGCMQPPNPAEWHGAQLRTCQRGSKLGIHCALISLARDLCPVCPNSTGRKRPETIRNSLASPRISFTSGSSQKKVQIFSSPPSISLRYGGSLTISSWSLNFIGICQGLGGGGGLGDDNNSHPP